MYTTYTISNYVMNLACNGNSPGNGGCCDGYLSICTLDNNCETSRYYENNWPTEFIATVIDVEDKGRSCCYKVSDEEETRSYTIQPEDFNFCEFTDGNPVSNVRRCLSETGSDGLLECNCY